MVVKVDYHYRPGSNRSVWLSQHELPSLCERNRTYYRDRTNNFRVTLLIAKMISPTCSLGGHYVNVLL